MLQTCSDDSNFYCGNGTTSAASAVDYSGTTVQNQADSGTPTQGVTFSVGVADSLFANPANLYFNNLAGPAGSSMSGYWDWGLPFFFERYVYTAIAGQPVCGQKTPFIAY